MSNTFKCSLNYLLIPVSRRSNTTKNRRKYRALNNMQNLMEVNKNISTGPSKIIRVECEVELLCVM